MTMVNYDKRDGGGDEDKNKDSKNNGNDASVSGSDDPIFDQMIMSWSCGGESGDNFYGSTAVAHYIYILLNMCHKRMYAKFGVLYWCRCHMKTNPS